MTEAEMKSKIEGLEQSLKQCKNAAGFAFLLAVGSVLFHFIPHSIEATSINADSLYLSSGSHIDKYGGGQLNFRSRYTDTELSIDSNGLRLEGNSKDPVEKFSVEILGRGIFVSAPGDDPKDWNHAFLGMTKYQGNSKYEPHLELQINKYIRQDFHAKP
jgi:hypothetical protein